MYRFFEEMKVRKREKLRMAPKFSLWVKRKKVLPFTNMRMRGENKVLQWKIKSLVLDMLNVRYIADFQG